MIEILEKVTHGMLERVGRSLLDVVFPARCVGCGREGQYICMQCEGFMSEAALVCPVCQQASFTGERHQACQTTYGLDGLACVWDYEGVVKSLVHSIAHNGVTHAIGESVERMFLILMRDSERFQQFLSFLVAPETAITYVPMHRGKEKHRGFNQAELFAREIARMVGKEPLSLLQKIIDTKPQSDVPKEDHSRNVNDAFVAQPGAQGIRRVVLVDDAWVTGATMKECCKILKRSGMEEVWGFALARLP